eukprot:2854688-Amphidinium_carterae.1
MKLKRITKDLPHEELGELLLVAIATLLVLLSHVHTGCKEDSPEHSDWNIVPLAVLTSQAHTFQRYAGPCKKLFFSV